MAKDLKFGVNYVPSKEWFYSWQHFNEKNVEEDLAAIASLGVDHIRMHLRWDLLQPNDTYVSEEMLERLKIVLDIAHKNGLKAQVTVLNGWMSGFWFLPSFVWQSNIIAEEAQWENQFFLLKKLSNVLVAHPAFMGIDVGNELNVYGMMIKPFTIEQGDRYLSNLLAECKRLFPTKQHVIGVDHQPWYKDAYFSRKTLANTGDITSIHAWAKFIGAMENGALTSESLTVQEYNIELANAYAENRDRKVWIQEFGISPCWTEEKNFREFLFNSMANATRSENLWGYTFWCSHDVSREYKFNEAEYELGLFDVYNRLKPVGKVYKDCIAELKSGYTPTALRKGKALIVDENVPFYGWQYARAFANAAEKGEHLQFVLSSKAQDRRCLERRGIEKTIPLEL